jgi:hypothetical protein
MKPLLPLIIFIPILLFSKAVKLEEILSDKNQIKLDFSTKYININQKSNSFSLINYQTSGGDYVTIPTFTGDNLINKDILNYSLNLKYGVTKKFEIFSYISGVSSFTKISSGFDFRTDKSDEFSTLGLGAIYQLRKEDTYPSLLIGGSTQAINRVEFQTGNKDTNFKANSIFLSSFYTTDPIVFFLKTSFQKNEKTEKGENSIQNGDIFSLEPQIYFAVNPYTSLNFGFNYSHQGKSRGDKEVISNSQSTLSYLFGMSYEIDFRSVFSMDIDFSNTPEYSQNSFSINYSYKF